MEWVIYSDTHRPLRDELIDGVSKIIQFELPKDYVACVKQFHGAQPKFDNLTIEVDGHPWAIGFGTLLTLDPLEAEENVIESLATLRRHHELPSHYLPIVLGGAGDYLCFDYSQNKTEPAIVFYFHELEPPDAFFPVAKSFTELLTMLKQYKK